MQRQTKYNGLKRRDAYEEIINYLAVGQPPIKYPDRWAKRVRESPYLEEQQKKAAQEAERTKVVTQMASGSASAPQVRSELRRETGNIAQTQYFNLAQQDADMTEGMQESTEEVDRQKRKMEENTARKRENYW